MRPHLPPGSLPLAAATDAHPLVVARRYSAFYDVAYSVLFYSYVLELLPFGIRTKGLAVCLFADYGALFFNQYSASPLFLPRIEPASRARQSVDD